MKIALIVTFGLLALLGLTIPCSSYITFDANVIQFGMDKLRDSPSENSVLFIHWFVFSTTLGPAITRLPASRITTRCWQSFLALGYLALVMAILLAVSLCFAQRKHHRFMIDQASRNPYKLVYKVIKFAAQHKTPIRRSAFTYCEDELPSRMDLGKDKYGGPFTTEQVEDVKAFLGIMVLLLTLGPMFATDIAGINTLSTLFWHLKIPVLKQPHSTWYQYAIVTISMGLSEFLVAILIPLYICLLRPFIRRYVPGMRKRIGLEIIVRLLSLLSTTLIDTTGHITMPNKSCFIPRNQSLHISWLYLLFPNVLNALSAMLFEVGTFEFMCAQSPHAMKGLIIGTFFAIKGIFQFLGVAVLYAPIFSWSLNISFPSCGFVYYLVNILVALSGLVAYTCVARRYQYRQRDEPDNVYRYAEDYYDRAIDSRRRIDYSSDYT